MSQETNKKYIILKDEKMFHKGYTLYRIQALKDFANVKKGDKGGWVEGYHNLSQEGNCWVYDEAIVYNYAFVSNDARVSQYAEVYDYSVISDYAKVSDNAKVYGYAKVYDHAKVVDEAEICSYACLFSYTKICGNVKIFSEDGYITFRNNWTFGCYFTYTKSNKMWSVGCFYGTGDKLIKYGYQESELSGRMYEKYVNLIKEQEVLEKEFSKK